MAKFTTAAAVRFDQILLDGQDGNVDASMMQATLNQAMGFVKVDGKAALEAAGFSSSKNSAADQQHRAKAQIAQAFAKNSEMMANLTQSFESKLSESDAESLKLMKSLGIGSLTAEQMKVTPSLRNLNQDPTMSDALVYYLLGGETIITTTADESSGEQVIALGGAGLVAKHGGITYDTGSKTLEYVKMGGCGLHQWETYRRG